MNKYHLPHPIAWEKSSLVDPALEVDTSCSANGSKVELKESSENTEVVGLNLWKSGGSAGRLSQEKEHVIGELQKGNM